MSEPGRIPDQEHALRHTVEDERLRIQSELAAANARTPGEWFDIFTTVGFSMVRRELESRGFRIEKDLDEAFDKAVSEHKPFYQKVRAVLEAHGLPITEEIEIEGPQIERDVLGMMHNVSWPRGAWLEVSWPENKSETLRFEGRCASVALEFLQWWDGFHQTAMRMAGKEMSEKTRLVDPNSPEYSRYITGKREALGE